MSNTSDILDITVTLASGGIGSDSMTQLLIVSPDLGFAATLVKEYASAAALLADSDSGLATSDQCYKDAVDAFASRLRPKTIKFGKVDSTAFKAQEETVTVVTTADGTWAVTINGTAYSYLASSKTAAEVAAALVAAIGTVTGITISYTPGETYFHVASSTAGIAHTTTLGTAPAGGAWTSVTSQANVGYQDALDLIKAEDDDWYGFTCTERTVGHLLQCAEWAETDGTHLFVAQASEAAIVTSAATDLATTLKSAGYQRTALLYYGTDTEGAAAAWAANRLRVDPDYNTTIWSFVTLASITVDDLSLTEQGYAEGKNANYYVLWGPAGITRPGVLADGTKINLLISKDWLTIRLREKHQTQLIDYANRGSKIPMDNRGISIVRAAAEAVFRQGVTAGHFSSYSLDFPDISEISDSDVTAGRLTYSFAANSLGGIEGITVSGVVGVNVISA